MISAGNCAPPYTWLSEVGACILCNYGGGVGGGEGGKRRHGCLLKAWPTYPRVSWVTIINIIIIVIVIIIIVVIIIIIVERSRDKDHHQCFCFF